MSIGLPLKEWCNEGGLVLISFPIQAEYSILHHVLESFTDQQITIIHSKPITSKMGNITSIDATGHALTAGSALRRRISQERVVLENPADTQGFLSQLKKFIKSFSKTEWWLWWSPSDLVAQEVDDLEIAQCLRVIAKDFSGSRFLAFVARDVHTTRGLAIMKYISGVYLRIMRCEDKERQVHHWQVIKHPNLQLEGDAVEL
jgi:hypothetical protein